MNTPTVETVAAFPDSVPEIVAINYDLWTLRVTAHHPGVGAPHYVEFDGVIGFRVLDEGDLAEFWNPAVRADGWLWEVTQGGWLDLEASRSTFMSHPSVREYLILGTNDCVSVLTKVEVVIREPAL